MSLHCDALLSGTLRNRLYLFIVLVVGLAGGGLATLTYLLVRQTALSDSAEAARAGRRLAVSLAEETLSPEADGDDIRSVLDTLEHLGRLKATIVTADPAFSTVSGFDLGDVPRALRRADPQQQQPVITTVANQPYAVVGATLQGLGMRIFLFYPQEQIHNDLRKVAALLAVGWAVIVAVAALVGRRLAGSILRPFTEVARIACSIARGNLHSRLRIAADDEVGSMAAAINEMADAIERKVEELEEARDRERRFAADAAHELRTAIGSLVAEASFVQPSLDDAPSRLQRPVALMIEDVARLNGLVEDLLELHRVDSGRAAAQMESVDLRRWVQELVRRCGWEHDVRLASDDIIVETDPRSLERVLVNLIDNGLKHGKRDVRVDLEEDREAILIRVSDRGDGIAEEHLSHLFEPLYKVDASRSNRGAGLGLSIAAQHAQLLGATIAVESREKEGAMFIVTLPHSRVPVGDSSRHSLRN